MKGKHEYFWMREAESPKDYDGFIEMTISGNKRAIGTFRNLEEIPCVFKVDECILCDYLPNDMTI